MYLFSYIVSHFYTSLIVPEMLSLQIELQALEQKASASSEAPGTNLRFREEGDLLAASASPPPL